MSSVAHLIDAELAVLVGQPLVDCWRAANMPIFEFGPRRAMVNRRGDAVEVGQFALHVQCGWRMVDGIKVIFASGDLSYPADKKISLDDFDWDRDDSVLDVVQRCWFEQHRHKPLHVVSVRDDVYGGLGIELERGFALEGFPCHSDQGAYSEHWRLLGHRSDGTHFVVTAAGVEDEDRPAANGSSP